MTDVVYHDGADYLPPEAMVKAQRPKSERPCVTPRSQPKPSSSAVAGLPDAHVKRGLSQGAVAAAGCRNASCGGLRPRRRTPRLA